MFEYIRCRRYFTPKVAPVQQKGLRMREIIKEIVINAIKNIAYPAGILIGITITAIIISAFI